MKKTIQTKIFIFLILVSLILIPFVYAEVVSDTYTDNGKPLSTGTPSTNPTTNPSTTPSASPSSPSTDTKNPLDWIKSNSKGMEIKETRGLYGLGKVTGAVATFQNPDSELKYKDSSGKEQSISGILPKTDSRKAQVTFNPDGTIQDIKMTTDPKATKPLSLSLSNTKLEVPQGAILDYNKDNNKAVVALNGGKLSEMPQQIDSTKKDGLKVSYQAEETTQLPNGIVLEKNEKSFTKSTIDSIDGKDYISVGNTARLNGMNGYNPKYSDNVNQDTEILGLRGKVTKTDMSSGMSAKNNYILIDPKNGVFEVGAGKGKTGLIINPNLENDFITGLKENSFFAYQARNGGILQITKQGNNLPSQMNTYGEYVFGSGTHTYYNKGDGKILVDAVSWIPGLGFDRNAKDIASVPVIMKNYDQSGKEINKGYMVVMNNNNGYAMIADGTTQARLSNGDTWRSSLYEKVSPPGSVDTTQVNPGGNLPLPQNPGQNTLPDQTDNSNGPKTTKFNPSRDSGGYKGIEGDVISHTRPGAENTGMTETGPGGSRTITVAQTDAMTGAHEMEHDVNSVLRNEKGVKGYWGFYTGNNQAVYVKDPGIDKTDIVSNIPTSLQGSRMNYLTNKNVGFDTSLYIFDEAWAYNMGSRAALETGSGSVTGLADMSTYGLAAAKTISEKNPQYWNSPEGAQYRSFLGQTLKTSMGLLNQGISAGKIDNVEQQRIYSNLRTSPDAEGLRQFAKQTFGSQYTKQVFGF